MQTTRLNSTFLTGATVAPCRILTHAEVAERFITLEESERKLDALIHNFYHQKL